VTRTENKSPWKQQFENAEANSDGRAGREVVEEETKEQRYYLNGEGSGARKGTFPLE
jgi:hypothetical protein